MKRLKTALIFMITLSFLMTSFVIVANADTTSSDYDGIVALCIGKTNAVVEGELQKIDSTNPRVVPFVNSGRTFVPVRFVSEGLGATVKWDKTTQTVTVTSDSTTIKLTIGKKVMYVDDDKVQMDVAAITSNGRTFIPIKYIADALDNNIFYDDGLVILSSDDKIDASDDEDLIADIREMITNAEDDTTNVNIGDNNQGNLQKPDMGDLRGEVTAIDDDEITLKLIKMPEFNGGPGGQPGNGQPPQATGTQNGTQTNGQQRPPQGQPPQATGTQNGAQTNGQPPQQRTIEYTGETKTITIPDSATITTMVMTDNKMTSEEIEVEDIEVGNIVTIWYSDDDSTTISKVSVQTLSEKSEWFL